MPNYDYHCLNCEHVWTQQLLIADRDMPLDFACPHCGEEAVERPAAAPGISHVIGGYKKVPEGFKDVLRKIKKNNVGSLIEV